MIAGLLTLAAGSLLLDPSSECDPGRAVAARSKVPDAVPAGTASPRGAPRVSGALPARDLHDTLPLPKGMVGVPVQLAEPGTAAALRPGDRVDVLARTGDPAAMSGPDAPLAHYALVLDVPSPADGVLYLAMTPPQARQVARLPPDMAIGVLVRPG
jgi:hypothetical protein